MATSNPAKVTKAEKTAATSPTLITQIANKYGSPLIRFSMIAHRHHPFGMAATYNRNLQIYYSPFSCFSREKIAINPYEIWNVFILYTLLTI